MVLFHKATLWPSKILECGWCHGLWTPNEDINGRNLKCLDQIAKVFLLWQIWIIKYSTVDCKYLLFLQDFFFRLKPKQYKKCQYSWLFKKTIWKLIKNKVNIYNQQLNFWLNNWRLHNWRSRKPQLMGLKYFSVLFRCSFDINRRLWLSFMKCCELLGWLSGSFAICSLVRWEIYRRSG